MTVTVVTDSGSDLTPSQLREYGIRQVPLTVSFGERSFQVPDEMKPDEFWEWIVRPDSPFPATAAPSPAGFKRVFEDALGRGDDVVYAGLSETLSATLRSGQMAKEMIGAPNIEIVDSRSACMGVGFLALRGAELAAKGMPACEIAAELADLRERTKFYVAVDTLDYLKRGGRISGARAAIGGLLSVKPIFTVDEGIVVPADQPRTRAKARERLIELMTARPVEALAVMYTPPFDGDALRDDLLAGMPGPAPEWVSVQVIGPVIGTHVGPGAYGGVVVYRD